MSTDKPDPWASATFAGAEQAHHLDHLRMTFAERLELNSQLCAQVATILGRAAGDSVRRDVLRQPRNIGFVGYLPESERRELGLDPIPTLSWTEWERARLG